jgi:hypothetical protein
LGAQTVEVTYVLLGQVLTLFYFTVLIFGFTGLAFFSWCVLCGCLRTDDKSSQKIGVHRNSLKTSIPSNANFFIPFFVFFDPSFMFFMFSVLFFAFCLFFAGSFFFIRISRLKLLEKQFY